MISSIQLAFRTLVISGFLHLTGVFVSKQFTVTTVPVMSFFPPL